MREEQRAPPCPEEHQRRGKCQRCEYDGRYQVDTLEASNASALLQSQRLEIAVQRLGGVENLLPDRWGRSHPEHVLTHRLEESREKARRRDARRAERRGGK